MTIISRRHGFIFLKSHKTAGSSVELHLVRNTVLGNDIYYTVPEAQEYGLSNKRRHCVLPLFGTCAYLDVPRFIRKRFTLKVSQHNSAKHVKDLVTPAFWDHALKVCGVRNPWDLLLSYWRWRSRRDGLDIPFEQWAWAAISGDTDQIEKSCSVDARRLLHNYLFIESASVVDHLIHFECLSEGLEKLSYLLNVDIPPLDIHEKSSKPVDYRLYYSANLAEKVGTYFSDVIELTGYSFQHRLRETSTSQQAASASTTENDK